MKNPNTTFFRLILAIAIVSTTGYLAIIFNSEILKYATVIIQFYSIMQSIKVIFSYKSKINWSVSIVILIFLFFYTFVRLLFDAFAKFEFKAFTDALILQGAYYQLIIVGLSLAVLTEKIDFYYNLKRYIKVAFFLGIILFIIMKNVTIANIPGVGHLLLVNSLIPLSIFAFFPSQRKTSILGWIAIFLIFFTASLISSRSYVLVGFLIAFFAIKTTVASNNNILIFYIFIIFIVVYLTGVLSFFNENTLIQDQSIIDKFQLSTLSERIKVFANSGSFETLFYWEGNSRALILEDAFRGFTSKEFLFGRGIFGTYDSFVQRHTIEIGWAQDIFRWGVFYVIFTIFFVFRGIRTIVKRNFKKRDSIFMVLKYFLIIILIDKFIYGIPQISLYNLFFFWGLMIQGIFFQSESKNIYPNENGKKFDSINFS